MTNLQSQLKHSVPYEDYTALLQNVSSLEQKVLELQSELDNATAASEPQEETKPTGEGEWHTYGVYTIEEETNTYGDFSIPKSAQKIRLTFKVTYTYSTPQYFLQVHILQEGNTLWEVSNDFTK